MFKVVCTIEKNGANYTAIPENWEKNSILFWPSHLKRQERENLRSNSVSKPNKEWSQQPCAVKVKNIKIFSDALKEEQKFADFSDTEAEERYILKIQQNVGKRGKSGIETTLRNSSIPDFNYLIKDQETIVENLNENYQVEEQDLIHQDQDAVVDNLDLWHTDLIHQVEDQDFIHQNEGTIVEEILMTKENVNGSIQIQIDLLQDKLNNFIETATEEFAKLNIKIDKILKTILNKPNFLNENPNRTKNSEILKEFEFPLKTTNDVEKLEKNLNIQDFEDALSGELEKIGGTYGREEGSKITYKIIDFLFEPDLLVEYSWTGLCRTNVKGQKLNKNAFITLRNITNLIYEVVLKADSHHSKERNEIFLRDKILKHTAQRLKRKKHLINANEVEHEKQ